MDRFTRAEASHLAAIAREKFPEWHPFVLCGLRTDADGELLALEWGDIDWRSSTIRLSRNIVRGALTTPKNHPKRRVDLSPQLRAVLRLARRRQAAAWFTRGKARPRKDVDRLDDAFPNVA
jgi:integrase